MPETNDAISYFTILYKSINVPFGKYLEFVPTLEASLKPYDNL